ncbi:MAG TPA: hypothetical protein PKI20_16435 [Verrucomicrobiota bacterium]|nr:hypothetical protein [Verrucomicrobiota bacterium]HQL79377.1 hypothetical protein [Verrucomicrobiota bacterium]
MNTEPKHRRWPKVLPEIAVALVGLGVCLFLYWNWKYPYGMSHCCIKGVSLALVTYAQDHGGHFPAGDDTPEASLSLLYSNYIDAYWLSGKTVPLEVVKAALAGKGKLGPDSCGWHYVEGLTQADAPEIAILWDKVGLGHSGERLRGGGHEVAFVDGSTQLIRGARWLEFLEKQKQLLAQRNERAKLGLPALTGKIRFPDGTEVSDYEGPYILRREWGSESGSRIKLQWMRFNASDGPCTLRLELPARHLRSKPVHVQVSSNRVTPDSIVFEMEPY